MNEAPIYYFVSAPASVYEGDVITVKFRVNNVVAPGTTLYWTVATGPGPAVDASDFSPSSLSGAVIVQNNGYCVISLTSVFGEIEGLEFFSVELRTGSITGPVVSNSSIITLIDTVQTLSSSSNILYEAAGGALTTAGSVYVKFILTTDIPDGTILYWTTIGSAVLNAGDFTGGLLSGTLTVTNGICILTRDVLNNNLESIFVTIRTGSVSGPIVATSPTVMLLEPTTWPTYSYSGPSAIAEGGTIDCSFDITNTPPGTLFYWSTTLTLGLNSADFTGNQLSGSVVLDNNGKVHISRTLLTDQITKVGEKFAITLLIGSVTGHGMVTSGWIIIGNVTLP